jgi:hypothetical protein
MSYATLGQLAGYMFDDETATGRLPTDASRLLKRASELVQDYTVTAFYASDAEGNPTDERTISAFQNATCAQVEYWVEGDEEDDIAGPLQGMSAGSQQQQYGAGANRATPMYLAPRAARFLRLGGLMDSAVQSV